MCDESSSFSWMLRTESKIDASHVFDLVKQTRVAVAYVQQHVTRMSGGDFFFFSPSSFSIVSFAGRGRESNKPAKTDEVQSGNQSSHSARDSMNGNLKPSCVLCVVFLCRSSSIYLRTTAAHRCPSPLTRRASTPPSWAVRPASWLCRERSARYPLTWQGKIPAIKKRTSPDRTPTRPDRNT